MSNLAIPSARGQTGKSNVETIYPLSHTQQGMLFHTLYAPLSGVYVEQWIFTLCGDLDVSAFKRAWQRVIQRHPTMRTIFIWEQRDRPLQVVRKRVELSWEQHNWQGLPASEQQERLDSWLRSDRDRGFDLTQAPPTRFALFQTAKDTHEFAWSFHHLLLDGWSAALIRKEILIYYDAFCQGKDVHLEPGRPYRDYIAWLGQQDLSKAEAFWRRTLKGLSAPTPFGVDRTDVDELDTSLGHERGHTKRQFCLPASSTAALQSLARQNRLTMNTLMQGAWALLLSRYSGEGDIIFGATISSRPPDLAGVESMVGLFINTLPVRVQVSAHRSLLPWLKDLQAQQIKARQYDYSPLVKIQGWGDFVRGQPLFESILVFENYPWEAETHVPMEAYGQTRRGRLEVSNVRYFARTNYPLTLSAIPGAELSLGINYDDRRFDASTITRMMGHFQTLLESIAANPGQTLSELPLLTKAERQQLLVEWNDTSQEYPQDQCLHQRFQAQVERTPDAVAVVFEEESLTFEELNRRANQLAHYMRGIGVGPETCVGICTQRSLEMIVGVWGILKAGGAYIPLDPKYPQGRIASILQVAQSPVLLTQQGLVEQLPEHGAQVICLDTDWPQISRQSADNPAINTRPQNKAYVIFTSGSTGQPKGVVVEHRSVLNLLTALGKAIYTCAPQPREQLRISLNGPLAFDTSVKQLIQLLNGHTLYILPSDIRLDGDALLTYLQRHELDALDCTPSQLELLLAAGLLQKPGRMPAQVLIAGEAINKATWQTLGQATGITFYNLYGPTECTVDVTVSQVADDKPTIGRPLANERVYILDQHLHPAPIGLPGELHIAGANLARGYLNQPELTAERFIPDPFSKNPGERVYKTGDLARYLTDGNIEFLDRLDHQVKIRGSRVEPGEIEALLIQHPAVSEAVVMLWKDIKCVVAYLVAWQKPGPAPGKLRRFLGEKLPDYMIPSFFVMLETMPLTPNGKVDRNALPPPDAGRPELGAAYVAPRNLLEWRLAQIWADILGVYPVGATDNFFELGGHSLLAVRLIAQIQKQFEQHLPLATLFQRATVEHLASVLNKQIDVWPQSPLVEIQPAGSRPPFFCVHPVGGNVFCYSDLSRQLGQDQPFYGLQALGLSSDQPLNTCIEDMAACYIEALRVLQPEGPYLLGGWSMGGVVALEMAQQLCQQEQVALVALLDSVAPRSGNALGDVRFQEQANGPTERETEAKLLAKFVTSLGNSGKGLSISRDDLCQLPLEEQLNYVLERAREQSLVPFDVGLLQIRRLFEVFKTNVRALATHAPQVYPGRMVLFQASEVSSSYSPARDWNKFSTQPVQVYPTPGDHYSMLSMPNVQVLAEKLRMCLDRATASQNETR